MIIFKYFSFRFVNRTKLLNFKPINPQKSALRFCTIRRSLFYVPADDMRKIDKALALSVDCLAFDLSDSVRDDNKAHARENISKLLHKGNVSKNEPEWCVKTNSVQSGNEFICDIEAILSSNKLPPAIALSGIDDWDHLQWFSELAWKKLVNRSEGDRGPIYLILVIGSAKGIMRLPFICQKAQEMSDTLPFILAALVFDTDSLSDTLGTVKTSHGIELLYARQKLVLVAKAFGLQAIDMSNTNPAALEQLKNECKDGYTLGFTGKQVLHPNQIPVIHSEFCPSRSKIKRAQNVIRQFQKRKEEDMKGVTSYSIPMDPDALKISEHVINVAKASGKII